ncbi:MAG: riboflavin synthase [Saprospiraceae bacterium]|jgi:riboflavin synthase
MFTGIVEALGVVLSVVEDGRNLHLTVSSSISKDLKIDQSLAHNGVCLTVVNVENNQHTVTAIHETMQLTNLGDLIPGHKINLERCMKLSDRLDGHIVQGHVDTVAECVSIKEEQGSWRFKFLFDLKYASLILSKGSICVNGTSLTSIDPTDSTFEVAIIPYTYDNTTFKDLNVGDTVNLEFDIVGKYLERRLSLGLMHSEILP